MSNAYSAIEEIFEVFEFDSQEVRPTRWQGQDVSDRPEALMREMLHVNFEVRLSGVENLEYYKNSIKPNWPWAELHFQERVSGQPMNPGTEWANWPWGVNAEKSLDANGQFNHNYMERYWPRVAGWVSEPTHTAREYIEAFAKEPLNWGVNKGIRHDYGDLAGLVRSLAAEPDTRQAYLPVWFPEDTGDAHNGRKPCTLGYHFIMRNGKLDVVYYLRSCDLAHHFRDDMYLTIRLLLWVLQECRARNPEVWSRVQPGKMVVQITSLHMFINDFRKLYRD